MKFITFLVAISLLGGAATYAYLHGWIIITYPVQHSLLDTKSATPAGSKKKVLMSYWQQGKWYTEAQESMCPLNKSEHIHYLINCWLNILAEEQIMDKKVSLQTALIPASGNDVYLSFDHNPLPEECSTFELYMWVEGLLKTLRENVAGINNVQLLVNHQPLQNNLLDFSNPWPITGFSRS